MLDFALKYENELKDLKNTDFKHFESLAGLRQEGISGAALTYMYLYDKKFEDLPLFLQLISDYDCWQYKMDPNTTHFKIGIDTLNQSPTEKSMLKFFGSYGQHETFNIINKGKTIKSYIDQNNAAYLKNWGYESEIDGHKCYVVNKSSNSWVFGEKYNQYPLVVVWVFNGEKYKYSLYSSNKDIDCSKIAEKFCGGGHKGAAGFVHDQLIVKK